MSKNLIKVLTNQGVLGSVGWEEVQVGNYMCICADDPDGFCFVQVLHSPSKDCLVVLWDQYTVQPVWEVDDEVMFIGPFSAELASKYLLTKTI